MSQEVAKVVDVAGLQLHAVRKNELLELIDSRITQRQKTSIITPYSEFLRNALLKPELMALFNRATLRVADGVGVVWGSRYLSIPLTAKSFYGKVLQAFWQMVYSGAAILLHPTYIYSAFPEKIVGADLFWDLAELAERKSYKVYLLGAMGDVAERTATILQKRYPNISIVGTSNKHWDDSSVISDVRASGADMVFVAYQPPHQERWVIEEFPKTGTLFAIGLGGTFDYVTGLKQQPPRFIRSIGLEWLYRLLTQPSRIRRIWNGVIGLILALIRYKVFMSMPYRPNAVAVIQNREGKILLCQRNPSGYAYGSGRTSDEQFDNYWQFPQGGVDAQEDVLVAARREAFEEVGLENLDHLKTLKDVNAYDWYNARRKLFFNPYKFRGQMRTVVYFRHNGLDDEVQLDTHHPEFVAYQWVAPTDVVPTVHSERKELAEIVVKNL